MQESLQAKDHISSQPALPIDQIFGFEDQIAEGFQWDIYKAVERESQRLVFVKVLRNDEDLTPAARTFFELEYQILSGLHHPSIIKVLDFGVSQEGPYYSMELLEGSNLNDQTPLQTRTVCRYLRGIASSLALLHSRLFVHLDVNANNIFIDKDGNAKLLDYGLLSNIGSSSTVLDTGRCIAPELFANVPVDPRADIFSLGIVSYQALTGLHPFEASTLPDYQKLLLDPPPHPSEMRKDVPKQLGDFVLSMLQYRPEARPQNMTEVVELLTTLGELEPESSTTLGRPHISSPILLGREKQIDVLEEKVAELLGGHGGSIALVGSQGFGKSRLLTELAAFASWHEATVFHFQASRGRQSQSLARKLTLAVEHQFSSPEMSTPGKAQAFAHQNPGTESGTRGNQESTDETNVVLKLLDSNPSRPVVLLIDDLERAPVEDHQFLISLRESIESNALLLVFTVTKVPSDTSLLKWLIETSQKVMLNPLSSAHVEELVAKLFHGVPHSKRFATAVRKKCRGNPGELLSIINFLISKGTLKFENGSWSLPVALSEEHYPSAPAALVRAKLEALSSESREILTALSVHRYCVPFEQYLATSTAILGRHSPEWLEELLTDGLLIIDRNLLYFRDPEILQAVERELTTIQRRQYHRVALETSQFNNNASEENLDEKLVRAWHLIESDEQDQGAHHLAQLGLQLAKNGQLRTAIEPLVRAQTHFETVKKPLWQSLRVLATLTNAGYYFDPNLTKRYGKKTMELIRELCGLNLAGKLRRFLGQKLSLLIALFVSAVRFKFQTKGQPQSFEKALQEMLGTVLSYMGVSTLTLDINGTKKGFEILKPFRALPRNHPGHASYLLGLCLVRTVQGRSGEASDLCDKFLSLIRSPSFVSRTDVDVRRQHYQVALFGQGALLAMEAHARALLLAKTIEKHEDPLNKMAAAQIRAAFHATRGEFALTTRWSESAERQAAEGGSLWQVDMFMLPMITIAAAIAGDEIVLDRTTSRLKKLAESMPQMKVFANLALAAVALQDGRYHDSRVLFEQQIKKLPMRNSPFWAPWRGLYARSLNRLGVYDKALTLCSEALSFLRKDKNLHFSYVDLELQQAIAIAGQGAVNQAVEDLDVLLLRAVPGAGPMLLGHIHAEQARLATLQGDDEARRHHEVASAACYQATGNPSLMRATPIQKEETPVFDPPKTLPTIRVQPPRDVGDEPTEMTKNSNVEISPISKRPGLLALTGINIGTCLKLKDPVSIGRGHEVEIQVEDRGASRRHAEVIPDPQGRFVIRDLDSRNGTYVNGKKIKTHILKFGDQIELGNSTKFRFVYEDETDEHLRESQRMDAVGSMACGIAHEFNNALAPIVANLQYIASCCDEFDDQKKEALVDSLKSAEHAAGLTRDLLSFARRTEMKFEPVDLGEVTIEVAKFFQSSGDNSIDVECIVEEPLLVLGDRTQLRQVVLNLAANARDALVDGGRLYLGVSRAASTEVRTRCPYPLSEPCVRLRVRDTGEGMTDEIRARIFEPFFSTKEPGAGTGMGLSVVHGIVTSHNGQIAVRSTPEVGTTVDVYFTQLGSPANLDSSRPYRVVKPTQAQPNLVLLIDDETLVRRAASRLLTQMGFTTTEASDGLAGVHRFTELKKELTAVILDIGMPELSGDKTLARIREIDDSVPVMICTGYADAEQRFENLKVDYWLRKPFTFDDFVKAFKHINALNSPQTSPTSSPINKSSSRPGVTQSPENGSFNREAERPTR